MTNHRQELGLRVEEQAAQWWLERGAHIVMRNFRCRSGEIDLIVEERNEAENETELIFVEVRARQGPSWTGAAGSVDRQKRRHLQNAIRVFLSGYRGQATSLRVDIMGWDGGEWTHIVDAWIT